MIPGPRCRYASSQNAFMGFLCSFGFIFSTAVISAGLRGGSKHSTNFRSRSGIPVPVWGIPRGAHQSRAAVGFSSLCCCLWFQLINTILVLLGLLLQASWKLQIIKLWSGVSSDLERALSLLFPGEMLNVNSLSFEGSLGRENSQNYQITAAWKPAFSSGICPKVAFYSRRWWKISMK